MEILRKVTIRNVGWPKGAILKALNGTFPDLKDGDTVELLKIVGQTTQAKTGQTDNGEYVRLLGEFIATNLDTGEVFQSGQAILPNFVAEVFAAALHTSQSVEFALKIDAKAKESAATGYEFSVTPLMKSEPTDKMKRLLALAGIDPSFEAPKSLAAPAADKGKPAKAAKG